VGENKQIQRRNGFIGCSSTNNKGYGKKSGRRSGYSGKKPMVVNQRTEHGNLSLSQNENSRGARSTGLKTLEDGVQRISKLKERGERKSMPSPRERNYMKQ